jgi:glycerate kinase
MNILICPQAFKGGLRGIEAARAIAQGLGRIFPQARLVLLPVADGGDGTLEALVSAVPSPLTGEGRLFYAAVTGPLGEPLQAAWGAMASEQPNGRTAVIELARASGLALLPEGRRDPRRATTYGTGQLLRAALDAGYRRIIIGLGGSATNDGGAGIAQALGARFLDAAGQELPMGGAALSRLSRIDLLRLDPRLRETRILAAADVANPLCGPEGASVTYGPQKGASPEAVAELDAALYHFAQVILRDLGREGGPSGASLKDGEGGPSGASLKDGEGSPSGASLRDQDVLARPRMGAAGGAGAGLFALLGAEVGSGADIVCDALGLDAALEGADLVVVGEGRLDWQTAYDKAPMAVARRAQRRGVPVIAVAGSFGPGYEALLGQGIALAEAAAPDGMPLAEALARAPELVAQAAERAAQRAKALLRAR